MAEIPVADPLEAARLELQVRDGMCVGVLGVLCDALKKSRFLHDRLFICLLLFYPPALDRLDPADRRDYDKAIEIAPQIVLRESPIGLFLRTEAGDAPRAALRLARYWAARRWAFGERFLFPLNQTGSGALNADDIAFLRTGYLIMIPRGADGMVCLHNEGRMPRPSGDTHVRIVFYMVHVYSAYMHNTTILHVVEGTARPPIVLDPRPWQIFRTALPLRVTQNLVAQAYEKGKESLLEFYGFRCATVSKFNSRYPPNRIAANSIKGTFQLLTNKGLDAASLPRCLGGSYDYATQADWIRQRLSIEDIMSGAPLQTSRYRPCAVAAVTHIASVGHRGMLLRVADERARRKHNKRKRLVEEDPKEGGGGGVVVGVSQCEETGDVVPAALVVKERNNLYSRRSYQKRKLEMLTLEHQRDAIQAQIRAVRQNNDMLQGLLDQAHALVATHEREHSFAAPHEIFPTFLNPESNQWDVGDIGDDHSLDAYAPLPF